MTATPLPGGEYDSENLRKYAPTNRIYRKHLELFNRDLFRLVDRVAPGSVLEVGCGEGFLLRALADHRENGGSGYRLAGLDVRAPAVAYARRFLNGSARLVVGSGYHLPWPDDAFDLVVCSQVLEHLRDPRAALAELGRVGRRAVLVTVPREPLFRALAALSTRLGLGGTPGHLNFWGRRSFRRLLEGTLGPAETTTSTVYRLGLVRIG